jgi:uncharacterized protein (TIGR02246 family)
MASDDADIRAAIRAAYDVFESTFARGDSEGMASLYTTDGMLLPTGTGMITGSEDIAAFWQGAMDMGIKTAKIDLHEVQLHGEIVTDVGHYTLGGNDGETLDRGKYIVIWKSEGGEWKLHRDIWNTDIAPDAD